MSVCQTVLTVHSRNNKGVGRKIQCNQFLSLLKHRHFACIGKGMLNLVLIINLLSFFY